MPAQNLAHMQVDPLSLLPFFFKPLWSHIHPAAIFSLSLLVYVMAQMGKSCLVVVTDFPLSSFFPAFRFLLTVQLCAYLNVDFVRMSAGVLLGRPEASDTLDLEL